MQKKKKWAEEKEYFNYTLAVLLAEMEMILCPILLFGFLDIRNHLFNMIGILVTLVNFLLGRYFADKYRRRIKFEAKILDDQRESRITSARFGLYKFSKAIIRSILIGVIIILFIALNIVKHNIYFLGICIVFLPLLFYQIRKEPSLAREKTVDLKCSPRVMYSYPSYMRLWILKKRSEAVSLLREEIFEHRQDGQYMLFEIMFGLMTMCSFIIYGYFVYKNQLQLKDVLLIAVCWTYLVRELFLFPRDYLYLREGASFFRENKDVEKKSKTSYRYPFVEEFDRLEFHNVEIKKGEERSIIDFSVKRGDKLLILCNGIEMQYGIYDLLFGFRQVRSGEIRLNDINIETIYKDQYLRFFIPLWGMESILPVSIKENITLEMDSLYPDEEVEEVLKKVDLYDIIKSKEKGIYSNLVSVRDEFTEEELKRLLLARAIWNSDIPIVVLNDEMYHFLNWTKDTIWERWCKDKLIICIYAQGQLNPSYNTVLELRKCQL